MSRVLLDTHVFLWLQADPGRLGDQLERAADPRTTLLLSAASSWEIAIKAALGKLSLPEPPRAYVIDRSRRSGVALIDVSHADALAVAELPPLHRDPFDRLLVAQAARNDYVLMTADPTLTRYDLDVILVG